MKLARLLVADPVPKIAQHIAAECGALARAVSVVTSGRELAQRAEAEQPQMIVMSLELADYDPFLVIETLHRVCPRTLVVATYRELAARQIELLRAAGVVDLHLQPVDTVALYRIASARFKKPFRRHVRLPIALEVRRADGAYFGQTRDLSQGGMLLDAAMLCAVGDSVLVDLMGPDGPIRVRAVVLDVQEHAGRLRAQFEHLRGGEYERLADLLERARPWTNGTTVRYGLTAVLSELCGS
jgi:CheY-like chemotaxis protein